MQGKVVFKEVTNIGFCACMNPRAGSFGITPRMQRHFSTFAVQMPSIDIMKYVFLIFHQFSMRLQIESAFGNPP